MSEIWGPLLGILGTVGMVIAGLFTARATKAAAVATGEANRAVAEAAAAPAQRRVDLEVLQSTTARLDHETDELRNEVRSLRILVRALGQAYEGLRRWAVEPVGPPPEPEERVREYLRTGV